jgi:hypothetical protein
VAFFLLFYQAIIPRKIKIKHAFAFTGKGLIDRHVARTKILSLIDINYI